MSNLVVRLITGSLFVALITASLFDDTATYAVFSGFLVLGVIEFFQLFRENELININWKLSSFFLSLIYGLLSAVIMGFIDGDTLVFCIPIIIGFLLIELWRKKKQPLFNTAINAFGLIYLLIPFLVILIITRKDTNEFPLLLGMFILIWMNDSFAYATGRLLGKRKLIERISPNKTWEGTIGGILFSLLAGFIIGQYLDSYHGIVFWMGAAAIISPSCVVGDLLESLIKRNLNIKDSGTILPGHGGILDRFDATLVSAPMFLAWIIIFTNYY